MRPRERIQSRNAAQIKPRRIRRQMRVFLNRDRQPDRHIPLLDLARPKRTRPHPLQHQRLTEPANHIHVQTRRHHPRKLRRSIPLDHLRQPFQKVIRPQQPNLLTRPRRKNHIPRQLQLPFLLHRRHPLRDLQHPRRPRRIVVRPMVHLVHLIPLRPRTRSALAPQVIHMRPHDQRRRVEIRLVARR